MHGRLGSLACVRQQMAIHRHCWALRLTYGLVWLDFWFVLGCTWSIALHLLRQRQCQWMAVIHHMIRRRH
jgi:hypothetical protein